MSIVSNFSWVLQSFQEKAKRIVMQDFLFYFLGRGGGEVNKVHYSVYGNGELVGSQAEMRAIPQYWFRLYEFFFTNSRRFWEQPLHTQRENKY